MTYVYVFGGVQMSEDSKSSQGRYGFYLLMIDTYTSMMCDRGRSGVVLCIIYLYDEWYIPTTNVYL